MHPILNQAWFTTLSKDQKELVELSLYLYQREQTEDTQLDDYSFIIFPFAKAYEGFLKQYLFDLGLISQKTYEGKRFRIGRALNPDVRQDHRDKYWLYDDLAQLCSAEIARGLWETWLECRNRIFHYFPLKNVRLNLVQVEAHIALLDETITGAHECKIDALQRTSTTQP